MNDLVIYHLHSMLSNGVTNIDSITDFHAYVDAAAECGMKAIGFSEHGNTFGWVKKKEYIESKGMKYIHGIEAYLTDDSEEKCKVYNAAFDEDYAPLFFPDAKPKDIKKLRLKFRDYWTAEDGKVLALVEDDLSPFNGKSLPIRPETIKTEYVKTRDNYHVVLMARNYDGVRELNLMESKSFHRFEPTRFYYVPRITLDELFQTSDNIIVTSACLGGILHNGTPQQIERMLGFMQSNKDRCFLEIQHHNCEDQIEYNKLLLELSNTTGVPLIAGTDTHALTDLHMEGRAVLQKSKGVRFANEDEWDLTFKDYQSLIKAYKKQGSLPMDIVEGAIENTVRVADMVEAFSLDHSPKYPKLYPDSEAVFKQKINEGVISRGIKSKENYKEYVDRIRNEYDTYKHNGAIDFMLLEEDYKAEMRRQGVRYGYSRGSVSGSIIAYLLYITEVDSVKYNLNFERFMNRERVSLADVDSDWYSEDRDKVRQYLYNKEGLYCCDIVTFNTIALKGAIDDVCRALYKRDYPPKLQKKIDEEIEEYGKVTQETADEMKRFDKEYLDMADRIKDEAEANEAAAREKYKEVFKYVDLVNGVVVSVGNHPAGCVVSPFPVDEWFGTFMTASDKYPISVLNMKEIDGLNFVKLDVLGLDNVGLIYKTCDAAGIPYLTPDNTPPDDMDVWKSIEEDTTLIFQWESPSATAYLRKLLSEETIKKIKEKNPDASYMDLLSIGNGAIRPAGESYRDLLSQGIYRDNGNEELNKFLAPTLGYLVYQEQIIEFLHKFCGFTMGEADIVRRHFSKKTGTETDIPIIKNGGKLSDESEHYIKGFIATMHDDYGVYQEEAESIIGSFLQVIEDASDYLFSKNHADPYSWIGYICGYLRYHYPLEFITSALNIFESDEKESLAIVAYARKAGIKITPIKFRHSVAQYSFNKETNEIAKGISSIKYMNATVADEMYALRDNKYDTFIELLDDLKNKTSLNSRQLMILIELDFFDEFGDCNLLKKVNRIYEEFVGGVQYKKEKLEAAGFPLDLVRKYAKKETEKQFLGVDMVAVINEVYPQIKYEKRGLGAKIDAQMNHLGYVDIIDPRYKGMGIVLQIDTKYSPRCKIYSLKNGTTLECKINKKVYQKTPVVKGSILRIKKTETKPKVKMADDGKWVPVPGTNELWIKEYSIVNDL